MLIQNNKKNTITFMLFHAILPQINTYEKRYPMIHACILGSEYIPKSQ